MQRQIEALTGGTFDLLILGGGITGAGVALDAVLRGLRVALIDKGDFASGTSSVSSKLIHGGLRYLEQGAWQLVTEALIERRLLLHNAPHLVHPLRFVLPFYAGTRVAPWKWRAGLLLYDFLAGAHNLRRSRMLAVSRLRREHPGMLSHGLRGGAEYYDAQTDDARLCLEVLFTAAHHGAHLANYVEALSFEIANGNLTSATVRDHISGQEFVIHARQVLNATGPWVDSVCRRAGDAGGPYLTLTKGAHLVAPDRGYSAAFLLLHPADGRAFFLLPWQGKTLIGTTDTLCGEGPDQLRVTAEDKRYLLEGHNHYFSPPLSEKDVLNTFVGLRPLIRSGPGEPSSLSREYRLWASPSGLLSVAGGKYTTYRAMAETITDEVVRRLGKHRLSRTRRCRLVGAPPGDWAAFLTDASKRLCGRYPLDERAACHLVQRYGRRADDVAAYLDQEPELARAAVPDEPDLQVEFAYQKDHEMAIQPADFLLRRTRLGLFRPELLRLDEGGRLLRPFLPRRAEEAVSSGPAQ
jgi:glycerol-3-phosphate dehydrogenase